MADIGNRIPVIPPKTGSVIIKYLHTYTVESANIT